MHRMACCRHAPNKSPDGDEAGECAACGKRPSRNIQAAREVTLWTGPVTAYPVRTEACQRLHLHPAVEVLRLSALAFLLWLSLSTLVAAAWTILAVQKYQPCACGWPDAGLMGSSLIDLFCSRFFLTRSKTRSTAWLCPVEYPGPQ